MKIVQLITHMHELGGAQMHVFELSKALAANGHEVVVLGAGNCELTEELTAGGITYKQLKWMVVPIKPFQDIRAMFEVRLAIREIKPDIVAVHSSKAGIIGRLAAKSLHIPVVFTAHSWSFAGEPSRKKRAFFMLMERWVGKVTNGVITVSAFDYMQAMEHAIIPAEKMRMIHNGISDDVRCFGVKKRGTPPIRLLMVARFAEPKDHFLLLKALSRTVSKRWHLTLVGDGPLLEETRQQAYRFGLLEQITFVGEDRDVIARMREADIFLLISKSEGLTLSIIEAMREGLPVIASDVGGIGELIQHGQHGFLVEKGNASELANRLDQLITSENLRVKFGDAGRHRFLEKFDFHQMYEHTETWYKEVIAANCKKFQSDRERMI